MVARRQDRCVRIGRCLSLDVCVCVCVCVTVCVFV